MEKPRKVLTNRLAKELAKGEPLRRVLDVLYGGLVSDDVRFALFGGFLRDLLLGRPSRDLDLVAEGVSTGGLEYALQGTIARRTSFGGIKSRVASIPVDIWPIQDTWAMRSYANDFPHTLKSLVGTTLLNTEAIVAVLPRHWPQEPEIIDGGFFEAMEQRVVELNFEPNPSPALSAARAIRVAHMLQFSIGPRLQEFISQTLESTDRTRFSMVQVKHFGYEVVTFEEAIAFASGSRPPKLQHELRPFNLTLDFEPTIS